MRAYNPDLIIEATSVCDRACKGCYAPNLISGKDPLELLKSNSDLFLDVDSLNDTLESKFKAEIPMIAFRGGEPTLHPKLNELMEVAAQKVRTVVLETHGKWLLKPNEKSDSLLNSIKNLNAVVKISFDKMHRTTAVELKMMTDALDFMGIEYWVAVTESSESSFNIIASHIDWVSEDHFVFQKKATSTEELIKPRHGVISSKGILNLGLTVHLDFYQKGISALA